MIDPNWELVDLDPSTWRAIGRFMLPGQYVRAGNPGEHALYVLHDHGRVLKVLDTASGTRRDLRIDRVDDSRAVAAKLFGLGEWERVHVIDRSHLADVAKRAQESPRRELTLDAYYRMVFHLIWDQGDGYVSLPLKALEWRGWTYEGVKSWIERLPSPSSLILGVIDGEDLIIGLIAIVSCGLIRKVTTFEALPIEYRKGAVSRDFLERVWTLAGEQFAPPEAALICTPDIFERWISVPGKIAVIQRAIAAGGAFCRMRPEVAAL